MIADVTPARLGHRVLRKRVPTIRNMGVLVALILGMVLSGCDGTEALRRENTRLTQENSQLKAELRSLRKELENCDSRVKQQAQQDEQVEETIAFVRSLLAQKRYDQAAQALEVLSSGQVQRADRVRTVAASVATWIVIALLVLGFGGMAAFLVAAVLQSGDFLERSLRTLTLMIGFLVYFGASKIGIPIPELMLSSLATSNPLLFAWVSAIMPSLAGIAVSAFVIRRLRSGSVLAYRVVIFISVLMTTLFLDLFVNAFAVGFNPTTLSPNLFFVVGIGLYLIFRYESIGLRKG